MLRGSRSVRTRRAARAAAGVAVDRRRRRDRRLAAVPASSTHGTTSVPATRRCGTRGEDRRGQSRDVEQCQRRESLLADPAAAVFARSRHPRERARAPRRRRWSPSAPGGLARAARPRRRPGAAIATFDAPTVTSSSVVLSRAPVTTVSGRTGRGGGRPSTLAAIRSRPATCSDARRGAGRPGDFGDAQHVGFHGTDPCWRVRRRPCLAERLVPAGTLVAACRPRSRRTSRRAAGRRSRSRRRGGRRALRARVRAPRDARGRRRPRRRSRRRTRRQSPCPAPVVGRSRSSVGRS